MTAHALQHRRGGQDGIGWQGRPLTRFQSSLHLIAHIPGKTGAVDVVSVAGVALRRRFI